MTQAARTPTPELDDALVPLEYLPGLFKVTKRTIEIWMRADGIETHPYNTPKGSGMRHGRAVRWGDIPKPSSDTTRWRRRV